MLRSLLSYGVGEAFAKGLNLLLLLILPLVLPVEVYGLVVVIIAVEQVVSAFMLKGQNTAILRFHEENKSDHISFYSSVYYPLVKNALLLAFGISTLTICLLTALSSEWLPYALIVLAVPLNTAFELKLAYFRASESIKEYIANRIFFQLLKFIMVLAAAFYSQSVYSYIFGVWIALLIMIVFKGSLSSLLKRPAAKIQITKSMLAFGFPLGLQAVINLSYVFADRVMLNSLTGEAEVSIYSFSYTIATSLMFFVNVVVISLLTGVYKESDMRKAIVKLNKLTSLSLATVFIGAIFVYFALFPKVIELYDSAYEKGVSVLGLILVCNVFHVLYLHGYYKLTLLKTVNLVPVITFLVLLLNIACNYLLIPKLGINGAAYATLICEVTLSIIILFFAHIKRKQYDN